MKPVVFFLLFLFPLFCQGQVFKSFNKVKDGVELISSGGILGIYPLSDNTVRVKFFTRETMALPELVFIFPTITPEFTTVESEKKIKINCKKLSVIIDKQNGKIEFADSVGRIFLSELAGSRKLIPDSVMGEPCFKAELSFKSPVNEALFGLGQFQDGFNSIRSVSRRLTQVNSQISIPFIYSDKGYGLLWHQYGLTDFNPADNKINLEKQDTENPGETNKADVTTISGTQKVSQNQTLYHGRFTIKEDGVYSIFMDLEDMGNRHFVSIDGNPCIDQTNMWLPPTASALLHLKAGEHRVQLICKSDNKPGLYWKLTDNNTTFRSPNAKVLDYVVFYGPSADSVIKSYRNLTGNVPMFPKWAYGFWQCRERYTSGSQLVETVREFRNRKLPLDVIVQDWQYWGNSGWGVPQFDTVNYSNPSGFISALHDLNAHFNISIWSNPDKNSEIGKEFVTNNRFIPDTKWLDYFNPETRKDYWSILNRNMFVPGVDSWWMDAVEPENDALKGVRTYVGLGDFYRLTYPLMVSQAVYEGQRSATSEKRVCILTRSAFSGQQRYGIINWSGDIGGTWDAFKRQIVAGLNFSITGLPYWTTDIGGFFRPGSSQYTDEKYHELLTRWYQWGAFNPVFRIHGYQSETEPWKYGQVVEENMRSMLNLRYRLLPYIYSEAWQVTKNGSTMMRPMVMDFSEDTTALDQPFEYLFGKSMLVAPVTEAGVKDRIVYLPKQAEWFDFWTGRRYSGGHSIKAEAPLNKIPLFIKAGSIIPMGKIVQYVSEKPADTLEIHLYKGKDAQFDLYEDEGDNYNYEKGIYTIIPFIWNESQQTLTIGKRQGNYPGCLSKRTFTIVLADGSGKSVPNKCVAYSGERMDIKF
ncbi:MAG TPA: TIM-barrel domain-containing protein [Bacteroidales bacterium]|nr:TIM-barrel domain-containing protein [Bacteroidales bacterium]